jgi:hypothetical protein
MLHEYAFTPHVFSPSHNTDVDTWRQNLIALARDVQEDERYACPIAISGLRSNAVRLHSGWSQAASRIIRSIKDVNDRTRAEDLHKKLEQLLVARPPEIEMSKDDEPESKWAAEATKSHARLAIRGAYGSSSLTIPTGSVIATLKAATKWRYRENSAAVKGNAQEIDTLRPLLMHADMYRYCLPYQSGRMNEYIGELISAALDRPAGFKTPQINVYLKGPSTGPKAIDNVVHDLASQIKSSKKSGNVTFHFWHDTRELPRDRAIVGYVLEDIGEPMPAELARWGAKATHLSAESRARPASYTWSLLYPSALAALHEELEQAISNSLMGTCPC